MTTKQPTLAIIPGEINKPSPHWPTAQQVSEAARRRAERDAREWAEALKQRIAQREAERGR